MLSDSIIDPGKARASVRFNSGDFKLTTLSTTWTNHLFGDFIRNAEIPLEPFDILYYLNAGDLRGTAQPTGIMYYLSDHPPTSNLGALYDSAYFRWHQRFNSIVALFNGSWDFARGKLHVEDENPCLHRNIVGEVESGQADRVRYRSYYDDDGLPTTTSLCHRSFLFTVADNIANIAPIESSYKNLVGTFGDVEGEQLQERIAAGEFDWGTSYLLQFVTDFTFGYEYGKPTLRWVWSMGRRVASGMWRITVCTCMVQISPSFNFVPVNSGDNVTLNQLVDVEIHTGRRVVVNIVEYPAMPYQPTRDEWISVINPSQYAGAKPDAGEYEQLVPLAFDRFFTGPPLIGSGVAGFVGFDLTSQRYTDIPGKGYTQFHRVYEHSFPDFASGAFSSTQDAIDTLLGSLEGNWIETAAEARDILSPLNLVKAFKLMIQSRGAYKGFLGVLRVAADADLTYRFGIAPLMRDAKDVAKNAQSLLDRIKSGQYFLAQTAYGKKTWMDVTGYSADFDPIRVACRSKIRLNPNLDGILPYILPLEALGLLPSLSRIWDLIPFSWMIDGFFNVSEAGSIADRSVIHMCFDVQYSVHSVSVNYDFTESEMTAFGFGGVGKSSPRYQLYVRYAIFRGLPVIGPTTLPIFLPPHLPDWDILGSVLVKRV